MEHFSKNYYPSFKEAVIVENKIVRNSGNINFKNILLILLFGFVFNFTLNQVGCNITFPKKEEVTNEVELAEVSTLKVNFKEKISYMKNQEFFDWKVKTVAKQLGIPSKWLYAYMYHESSLNFKKENKISKAYGLAQFLPIALKDVSNTIGISISPEELRELEPTDQLDLIAIYFENVKTRYGDFQSVVDFYIGGLYPKKTNSNSNVIMDSNSPDEKERIAYSQNIGLDRNHDGVITKEDIKNKFIHIFGNDIF